ncbi:DUF2637 domain-containing protein [Actinomadura opuntiae]|uniref:DUF2637 domain-containing protein n=1 Tax=Actinomadura sp. OS1-43 TaxID=604315 RepID=UPI00255AF9D6|nr:DUF2637 domain-containing protein [Actinomadura sp. OS1-43]MDL4815971.1 DUF2637 domain-containing protein [Actinomadura sp. OS1-43]
MRVLDHLPIAVLAVIAACGSFTHIAALAARSGQDGWMSYATAVCIDLLAVVASLEIRRDKRLERKSTVPTLVLSGAIVLTLGANLAEAQRTPWGLVVAGVPALCFLLAVALIERRGGADKPQAEAVEEPAQEQEPVVEPEPEPASEPKAKAPKKAKKPAQKPPKALEELLILAQQADAEHREKVGKRISRDALRAALGVSTGTASSVLRELRTA